MSDESWHHGVAPKLSRIVLYLTEQLGDTTKHFNNNACELTSDPVIACLKQPLLQHCSMFERMSCG